MATAERTVEMRATTDEIPVLLDRMEAEGGQVGAPAGLLSDLRLCLDELLVNVVMHGAPAPSAIITVHYRLQADGVWAEIVDPGPPFDPLSLPDPDIELSLDDRVPGGLGIYFVRRLMDEVVYERRDAFNRLRLAKRAASSPEATL
ncbi:serine/threonine-protein kinase RsbW [Stella humosa]|uniref:Serine/threonine-protein kinase RsbW n=1 Tax=Stella humosa TaxID=94 RepID=A0A3N1KXJ0_9PROT|nr:ATP-binding protein [Stella humosa]ROP83300.1 serine/threonine-protein kinase RsbW [Stella humosa]